MDLSLDRENIDIYKKFASIYANGQYPIYSQKMAKLFPSILRQFNITPKNILDIACGEGTFALEMIKSGYNITAVDYSLDMLKQARKKIINKIQNIKFFHMDMRSLKFREEFDIVTCWFDSLNYLLNKKDLEDTFKGVSKALKEGGFFIFDMNTIYGLSVQWQEDPCTIEQNLPELLEIHQTTYDPKRRVASLKVTVFIKKNNKWIRIEEVHKERGYTLKEIKQCLNNADLKVLACWGSLDPKTEPTPKTGRVWFVAKKINH